MQILTPRERLLATLFALVLGISLAVGYIPMVNSIAGFCSALFPNFPPSWLRSAVYLLVSFLFAVSLPRKLSKPKHHPVLLPLTYVLPIIIAVIFGWLTEPKGLIPAYWFRLYVNWEAVTWAALIAPVAEELLFRGWSLELLHVLWPKPFSITNPFPSCLLLSSFVFSLWHLQNISHLSVPQVAFQGVYTFFLGLWFGFLRWKSGKLWPSILAHIGVNVAAALF